MEKIKIGLIGLGNVGRIHLHNCLHLRNATLSAVADTHEKSLITAKEVGIKHVFKDYNDLLKDPRIDAVIISVPTFLHVEIAAKAAENQKNILIEKPIARNPDEALKIISVTKQNNVKLMVGYPLRFSEPFIDLKAEFESGTLGDIQIALASHISTGPFSQRAEFAHVPEPVPSWWFDKNLTGGGALIDLGCHMINLLRWYFGEVASIRSCLGNRFSMDFEDYAICNIRFKNGTIATLNVGWFARYHKMQIDLYGTAKHASATSRSPTLSDYVRNLFSFNTSTGFYKELEYFVDCVVKNVDPSPSGEDGLEDLKVISEAYANTAQIESCRK